MKSTVFIINDKSLEPEIPFGSSAVCCSRSVPRSGDFIVYVSDVSGGPIFRRYIEKTDGNILLQAVNPKFDSYVTTADQFRTRGKAFVILSISREFRAPDHPLEPAIPKNGTDEDYLTFAEAQKLLKVHRTLMYELLRSGKLRATKMGHLWRIPRSAIGECLNGSSFN